MTIMTPIVIDTVAAPRFDFTVRTNADWLQTFAFYNEYSPLAPWSNIDFWQPANFYQSVLPSSIVTYLGDLYVPSLLAPETWESSTTFVAEATYWTKIGTASSYTSAPFDLTGCTLIMALAQLDSSGLKIAIPKKTILTLSSAASPPTINLIGGGQASLNLLAAAGSQVLPAVYGYDMNILQEGSTITAVWGLVTVTQGAT